MMDYRPSRKETTDSPDDDRDLHNTTFSDSSSESGEDALQQKLCSWKVLVTHLQKELQSEKIKTRGQTAIINSLKETKSENVTLKENVKQKSEAIAVLQNRLACLGGETSVKFGDGEFLLPGPSKQVLDALAEENIELKKSLKYVAVDPVRVEKLQRQIRSLEIELNEVQRKVKHLESENKRLLELWNSSENCKDLEILRLQEKISELENNKDTQNILCQSLSEETDDLRGKLRETVQLCQNLEQRLNGGATTLLKNASEQESISALQVQVMKQNQEILQVTEMNMKWQKYNDQREEYVKKLNRNLSEVQNQLAKCRSDASRSGGGGSITEQQQADIDRIILQHKTKVEVAEEEKVKIEDENRGLRKQLANLQDEIRAKDEEITLLRGHVQVLSNRDSTEGGGLADKEKIQLLEQQITVWREDFEQERQDREKAVSKVTKLENDLHFMRRQLEQFQGHQMEDLASRRQQSLSQQERQYYGGQQQYLSQDLVGRGIRFETDGEDEVDGKNLEDVSPTQPFFAPKGSVSSPEQSYPPGNWGKTAKADTVADEDTLQCPKCEMVFPASEHFQLLDHINECC